MWKFTLELLCYVSFIAVLYLISYLNHGTEEFYQVHHLRNFLLNLQNETRNYSEVSITKCYLCELPISSDRLHRGLLELVREQFHR